MISTEVWTEPTSNRLIVRALLPREHDSQRKGNPYAWSDPGQTAAPVARMNLESA